MKKQAAWEEVLETMQTGGLDDRSAESGNLSNRTQSAGPSVSTGVAVGRIVAMLQSLGPLVDFPANTSGTLLPARSLVPVSEKEIGRDVALAFEENDPANPIILGIVQENHGHTVTAQDAVPPALRAHVQADEETLILTASKEIVLRCGKASITLTSAGKVLIRGAYLLSRSSGANRIKGGSVQIN